MSSRGKMTRYILMAVGALVLVAVIAALHFYQQGGKDQYVPPVEKPAAPSDRAINDLTTLGKAVGAYYGRNPTYPDSLAALAPDFVSSVPNDPATVRPYTYETDKNSRFRIAVPDPSLYKLKVLAIENGKLVKE
jgi:hypothetical protein